MDYESRIQDVKDKYEALKAYYYSQRGRKKQLEHEKSRLEEELQRILDHLDVLEKVRVLLQRVSEYAREQARQQIETLVTHCLQYIFNSDMEFKIEIEEVRGRPEAEFYVVNNMNGTLLKTRPQEARGGGVVDIISLALRIAMLQCSNETGMGPIILDEPAKHVSEEYIAHVGEFLRQISKIYGRQVIMVTHNRHLSEIADKSYRIELQGEVSNTVIDS